MLDIFTIKQWMFILVVVDVVLHIWLVNHVKNFLSDARQDTIKLQKIILSAIKGEYYDR